MGIGKRRVLGRAEKNVPTRKKNCAGRTFQGPGPNLGSPFSFSLRQHRRSGPLRRRDVASDRLAPAVAMTTAHYRGRFEAVGSTRLGFFWIVWTSAFCFFAFRTLPLRGKNDSGTFFTRFLRLPNVASSSSSHSVVGPFLVSARTSIYATNKNRK